MLQIISRPTPTGGSGRLPAAPQDASFWDALVALASSDTMAGALVDRIRSRQQAVITDQWALPEGGTAQVIRMDAHHSRSSDPRPRQQNEQPRFGMPATLKGDCAKIVMARDSPSRVRAVIETLMRLRATNFGSFVEALLTATIQNDKEKTLRGLGSWLKLCVDSGLLPKDIAVRVVRDFAENWDLMPRGWTVSPASEGGAPRRPTAMKSVHTMPRNKRFKERSPRAWIARHGDRVVIRRIVPATSWRFRDALARADERNAMGGRWVAAIDEVFPEPWLLAQADGVHPIAIAMAWPHALAVRTIADVADLVIALEAGRPAHGPVVARLRFHEEYSGAISEARVARMLRDAGASFEILPAKGGATAPDFRVGSESPFFCEVKHVDEAQLSMIEESLTSKVLPFVAMSVPRARWAFDWDGADVRQLTRVKDVDQLLGDLAERVVISIRSRLALSPLTAETRVMVEGVGSITIWPEAMPEGQVGADTVKNDKRTAGRAAQRVADAARLQFPKELPGVVVLCWEAGVLDADAVTRRVLKTFDDLGSDGRHVAGVVLLMVTSGPEGIVEQTWAVENPHGAVPLASLPLPAARGPTRTVRFSDFRDLFAVQ